MELLFGIYGRCFLAVGDILWAYFFFHQIKQPTRPTNPQRFQTEVEEDEPSDKQDTYNGERDDRYFT